MSESTYTDSRLITLNASNATIIYNDSLMSSCLFSFTNLLKDDLDILYFRGFYAKFSKFTLNLNINVI